MKKLILAMVLLVFAVPVQSQTGYSRVPWGSSTWTGPGRPPHWGPPQRQHSRPKLRRPRPAHPISPPGYHHRKPVLYQDSVHQSGKKRLRHVPVYNHRKSVTPIRTTGKCGGKTRTTKNRDGQMVIEYVTGAKDCTR